MSKGYDFLGEKIKKLRAINNRSQEELGEALKLPKQSISRIEKGNRKVSTKELDKIADFFNIPTMFFLEDGWIDNIYERNLPKNRWGINIPLNAEYFIEGLEEYFNYLDDTGQLNYKEVRKIIMGTNKALNKLLIEYKEKLK